jgi:hypothetical protein
MMVFCGCGYLRMEKNRNKLRIDSRRGIMVKFR